MLSCLQTQQWQLWSRYVFKDGSCRNISCCHVFRHHCGNSGPGMCVKVTATGISAVAMSSDTTVATLVQVCVYTIQQQLQKGSCCLFSGTNMATLIQVCGHYIFQQQHQEKQLLPCLQTQQWQFWLRYVFKGGSYRNINCCHVFRHNSKYFHRQYCLSFTVSGQGLSQETH